MRQPGMNRRDLRLGREPVYMGDQVPDSDVPRKQDRIDEIRKAGSDNPPFLSSEGGVDADRKSSR